MQFSHLRIENFGSIGSHVEVDLRNQGLVLITGRNDDAPKADSNGAGKSLILEAFCWCLWGQTIRGLKADEVVNRKAKKNCWVQVMFSEGTDIYTVQRQRKMELGKPNDLKISMNGQDMTGASMAQTQEIINELLGLDFTTFCVMMPGAGLNASEMTDKEVKDLLERLLMTEVLGEAYKHCREQLKSHKHKRDLVEHNHLALMTSLQECDERLGKLKTEQESFETARQAKLQELNETAAVCSEKIAEKDRILSKTEGVQAKLKKAYQDKEALQESVGEVGRAIMEHDRQLNNALFNFDAQLKRREEETDRLVEEVERLGLMTGACPTCHQNVPKEHIQAVITEHEVRLYDIGNEHYELGETKKEHLSAGIKVRDELNGQRQSLYDRRILLEKDVQNFTKLVNDREKATSERELWQDRLDQLAKEIQERTEAVSPFAGLIEDAVKEAFEKAAQAARKLKELRQLDHEIALYEYWVTGFSPGGVRSFMLEHVTPILNEAAKKYADLLTDGEMSVTFATQQKLKSGKTAERFNIIVEQVHGGASYAASSSGEKSRANLVVAFALGDLAAMRASKSVSFRFLDEPFENVDESGTDAIVALLNDQKERFDSVFVITHQDHFKQLFPKRLTVVKKAGVTLLEGDHV